MANLNNIITKINSFGELHTKWTSHKHPENPNYMQIVYWHVWEKDGKTTICWNLGAGSKSKFIYNMTKEEAIQKFTDKEDQITEEIFEQWLKERK